MHGTLSPFPGLMLVRCRLSLTLHVIVLFLANWKYQQTLHISLGACPTVFLLLPLPLELRRCAFAVCCTRLHTLRWFIATMHTVRWTQMTHRHQQSRTSQLPAVLGGFVCVQDCPVVGCDNVKMGATLGKMQRCYKYPPTPLSEYKVMCTAHGPFFARLRYLYVPYISCMYSLLFCHKTITCIWCQGFLCFQWYIWVLIELILPLLFLCFFHCWTQLWENLNNQALHSSPINQICAWAFHTFLELWWWPAPHLAYSPWQALMAACSSTTNNWGWAVAQRRCWQLSLCKCQPWMQS